MNPYWSYLLTAVGVFGLYLAGRKDRRGWMVGIGAQVLWIAYATATHQWGFYFSALAYGFVYTKNAHAWKPTPKSTSMASTRSIEMPVAMGLDWPPPPDIHTSVCEVCSTNIFWQECPTGGWWIHHRHPEDGHDAAPVRGCTRGHGSWHGDDDSDEDGDGS